MAPSVVDTTGVENGRVYFPGMNGVMVSLHPKPSGDEVTVPNEKMWKYMGQFADTDNPPLKGTSYLQVSSGRIKKVWLNGSYQTSVPPGNGSRWPLKDISRLMIELEEGTTPTNGWRIIKQLKEPGLRLLWWKSAPNRNKSNWVEASFGGVKYPITNKLTDGNNNDSVMYGFIDLGYNTKEEMFVQFDIDGFLRQLILYRKGYENQDYSVLYADRDQLVYYPEQKGVLDKVAPAKQLVFINTSASTNQQATGSGAVAATPKPYQTGSEAAAATPKQYQTGSEAAAATPKPYQTDGGGGSTEQEEVRDQIAAVIFFVLTGVSFLFLLRPWSWLVKILAAFLFVGFVVLGLYYQSVI